jgi:hypothetical protein
MVMIAHCVPVHPLGEREGLCAPRGGQPGRQVGRRVRHWRMVVGRGVNPLRSRGRLRTFHPSPGRAALLRLVASGDIGRTVLPNYLLFGSRERGGKFRLPFSEELAYVSPVLSRALGLH